MKNPTMWSLAWVLIFAAAVASQLMNDFGKRAIERAHEEAEQRLRTALEDADSSVLVTPLRQLGQLLEAGRGDQDLILSFGEGEDVRHQVDLSVTFWTEKMDEVVKPYVDHPEKYRYLIIDIFPVPPDPSWNQMKEYKEVEAHISGLVANAILQLNETHRKESGRIRPAEEEDATYSSWARLQLDRLLDDAETSIINHGQFAKREAAMGNEDALQKVKKAIRARKLQFNREVLNIHRQYEQDINI